MLEVANQGPEEMSRSDEIAAAAVYQAFRNEFVSVLEPMPATARGDLSSEDESVLAAMYSRHIADLERSNTWRRAVRARQDLASSLMCLSRMATPSESLRALLRCVEVCTSAEGAGGAEPLGFAPTKARALLFFGRLQTKISPMAAEETLREAERFIEHLPAKAWANYYLPGDTTIEPYMDDDLNGDLRGALLAEVRCALSNALLAMQRLDEALAPARAAYTYWTTGSRSHGALFSQSFLAAIVLCQTLPQLGRHSEAVECAELILSRSAAFPEDPARKYEEIVIALRDAAAAELRRAEDGVSAISTRRDAKAEAEALLAAGGPSASRIELLGALSVFVQLAFDLTSSSPQSLVDNAAEALACLDRAREIRSRHADLPPEDIRFEGKLRADLLRALGRSAEADSAMAEVLRASRQGGAALCAGCGASKTPSGGPLLKCAGCCWICYCGAACQRRDWGERHKQECKAMKIAREGLPAATPPKCT